MSYQTWSVACLACALVFLCLEIFLPSAGIFGIVTFLLVVTAITTGFMHGLYFGAIVVCAVAIAAPFVFVAAIRIWPHTPIGKRILIGERNKDDVLPAGSHYQNIAQQNGKTGTAKTKMYPSGIVVIDKMPFDAVTNGFPIEAGDRIRVISVMGNRLRVQKIDPGDESTDRDATDKNTVNGDSKNDLAQTMEDLGIEDFDLGTPDEPEPS